MEVVRWQRWKLFWVLVWEGYQKLVQSYVRVVSYSLDLRAAQVLILERYLNVFTSRIWNVFTLQQHFFWTSGFDQRCWKSAAIY